MKTKKRAGDKSSHSWASPSHRRPHQEHLPSKSSPTPPQKTASRRGWSSRDQTRNLTAATLQTAKLHTPDLPTHLLDEIPRLPSTSRCQKGNRRRRGATDSPAGTRTPPPTSRPSQNSNLIASRSSPIARISFCTFVKVRNFIGSIHVTYTSYSCLQLAADGVLHIFLVYNLVTKNYILPYAI
jgi:hypothetical protein